MFTKQKMFSRLQIDPGNARYLRYIDYQYEMAHWFLEIKGKKNVINGGTLLDKKRLF